MNIAIDCRYIGMSGIGKVCEGILNNLNFDEHKFFLIGNKALLQRYDAEIIEDLSNPYSIKGLFSFNKKLNKICDAIIIPNFLIPYGVKIPAYTIMHDLAFLDVKVTTKNFVDRLIKKILLKRCMKKSTKISCVSNFTKNRCEFYFKKYSKKCYTNYIGLSKEILEYKKQNKKKEDKIVFVGNVKPHKGIQVLLKAFKKFEDKYTLKIIGQKENFQVGLDTSSLDSKNIIFTGKISNEELYKEIESSKFLVLPSIYEGFGLPPLEALYVGTKPIISDIEVFKEVYKDFDVQFFKAQDENDLAEKILNSDYNVKTTQDEILKKYNFKVMTEKLLKSISKEKII